MKLLHPIAPALIGIICLGPSTALAAPEVYPQRHYLRGELYDQPLVLENYDSVEVLELTGNHMDELMVVAMAPKPVPPPLVPTPPAISGQLLMTPEPTKQPELNAKDFPTSVGVLVNRYPISQKGTLKETDAAAEMMKLITDDQLVAGRGGEEALPSPCQAVVFRSGKDAIALVYDGMLEVYLNDERRSWLMLTEQGRERFMQLYHKMAKTAGLRLDENEP